MSQNSQAAEQVQRFMDSVRNDNFTPASTQITLDIMSVLFAYTKLLEARIDVLENEIGAQRHG